MQLLSDILGPGGGALVLAVAFTLQLPDVTSRAPKVPVDPFGAQVKMFAPVVRLSRVKERELPAVADEVGVAPAAQAFRT